MVALLHPERVADHDERQPHGDVRDEVEALGPPDAVQELVDDASHDRLEGPHVLRRESLGDELAAPGVGRVVHLDHHRVGIGVRTDPTGAREQRRVRFDLAHVVVAGDPPDPVGLVAVDGFVLAHPRELVVRIPSPEVAGDEVDVRSCDHAAGSARLTSSASSSPSASVSAHRSGANSGTRHETEIDRVDVAPDRHVQADAFEDRAHRVQRDDARVGDRQRFLGAGDVGHHQVDRWPVPRREVAPRVHAHEPGEGTRWRDLGPVAQHLGAEHVVELFRGLGDIVNGVQSFDGIFEVGAKRGEHVRDLVAAQTSGIRGSRYGDAGDERPVGKFAPLQQIAPQRARHDREDHVVHGCVERVLHRLHVIERERGHREYPV